MDGHDIDCKVDGFGAMQLKSTVVKPARTSWCSPSGCPAPRSCGRWNC
nr:PhnA domain-containing protein [Streptomyces sp. B4I13]